MPTMAPPNAEKTHLRAHQKWDSGQFRSAFRLMLSAAKLGDSGAMLNLGYFYDLGIGVKANRGSAMLWYKRALHRGFATAANSIGTIYRDERKTRLALHWFEKAVALGDIDANLNIAHIHIRVLKNPQAATRYMKAINAAKPGIDVTRHSYEEAQKFLKLQK